MAINPTNSNTALGTSGVKAFGTKQQNAIIDNIILQLNDLLDGSISTTNLTLSGTLTVTGASALNGAITQSLTTQSTNKDTGAIVTKGGIGVEKNLNIGGALGVIGQSVLSAGTVSSPGLVVGANDNGQYEISTTQQGFTIGNTLVGGYSSTGLFTTAITEQVTGGGLSFNGRRETIIDQTGASLGLTAAQSGSLINLNRGGGIAITLPAAAAGLTYEFISNVTNSTGNTTITCNGADLLFGGTSIISTTANTTAVFAPNGSSNNVITLNATTTGGIAGTRVKLYATQAGRWVASGLLIGSGALATSYSG